jgi:hypothetical protein
MSLYDKLMAEHGQLGTINLCNGRFSAALMRAPRLVGGGVHGLPTGSPITTFPVDALPGAPSDWVKGAGSYACPVDMDWGLWFSWTCNDPLNTAVVPSVKGMNPITGKKLEDVAIEQYKDKCPVHDKAFKDGLYCEECDYRWPPQNYVASPNVLWWDGFRSGDGQVRQFVFSEEERRDIASIMMGKESTVPAFGFAFYEPEKRREPPLSSPLSGMSFSSKKLGFRNAVYVSMPTYYSPGNTPQNWTLPCSNGDSLDYYYSSNSSTTGGPIGSSLADKPKVLCSTSRECTKMKEIVSRDCANDNAAEGLVEEVINPERTKKDVSVGAGAIIGQGLAQDPLACKDWKKEPSALIRLYFVFPEQFRDILKAGIRDLSGKKDGFLAGMPVG